jgi:hypothetical protein
MHTRMYKKKRCELEHALYNYTEFTRTMYIITHISVCV